jgi:hypothetical protein
VSHRPPPPLLSGSPLAFLLSHPPPFAGLANVLFVAEVVVLGSGVLLSMIVCCVL